MNSLTIPDRVSSEYSTTISLVPWGDGLTGYVFTTEGDRTTGVYIDSTRMREMAQWLTDAADHLDHTPLRSTQ